MIPDLPILYTSLISAHSSVQLNLNLQPKYIAQVKYSLKRFRWIFLVLLCLLSWHPQRQHLNKKVFLRQVQLFFQIGNDHEELFRRINKILKPVLKYGFSDFYAVLEHLPSLLYNSHHRFLHKELSVQSQNQIYQSVQFQK